MMKNEWARTEEEIQVGGVGVGTVWVSPQSGFSNTQTVTDLLYVYILCSWPMEAFLFAFPTVFLFVWAAELP